MKTKHLMEFVYGVFSIGLLKSLVSSFGYYIHEQVIWRKKLNYDGTARIHATASIRNAQNIYVGTNAHINHHCCIWCGENSTIRLGDNLLMGPGVKMFSTNHGLKPDQPMTFQERSEADIIIGNDCWIGANSVILKGVTIAEGCVVAAGSVVSKSITEPYSIVGGIPAKKISAR